MPRSSARASTNGLNAEPGWRWPWVARLNGWDAYRLSSPPTMARTMPSLLEIATREACGPVSFGSQSLIAFCAAVWSLESIVVLTCRPPSNASRAPCWPPPSWSTICCLIQEVKYGYFVSSSGTVRSSAVGIGWAFSDS